MGEIHQTKHERRMRQRYEARAETKPSKHRAFSSPAPLPTMQGKGVYVVTFFRRGGSTYTVKRDKSPNDAWLLARGASKHALFAIRYWPSRKGWRILDMRLAQNFRWPSGVSKWIGHEWSDPISEEAAYMKALSLSAV